ncbi:DciA family protein [Hyphobacterium sp.]|uniref:DciA family protein n=1 Tax=Hyphobacterium sp. TaxID=2004662 RepID=UPI003BACEBCE
MTDKPPPSLETLAARYLRDRRGRPAIKGAPPAGQAAGKILKRFSDRFGPGTERLAEHWPDIVGERLAGWTAPDAIRGDTLYIVAKGPAGTLIEADAPRILERLKTIAGKRAPLKLRIRQGDPAQLQGRAHANVSRELRRDVQEKVEIDPDARLSSALERFERARRRREPGD